MGVVTLVADHAATGGALASLFSTLGAFKWLHGRSVDQGATIAEHGAKLEAHDREFADLKTAVENLHGDVRLILGKMMETPK